MLYPSTSQMLEIFQLFPTHQQKLLQCPSTTEPVDMNKENVERSISKTLPASVQKGQGHSASSLQFPRLKRPKLPPTNHLVKDINGFSI